MTTYEEKIEKLSTDTIARDIIFKYYGEDIDFICQKLMEEYDKNRSYYLFPGDIILVYPKVVYAPSKSIKKCDFTGDRINIKDMYINYRALLVDISSKRKYVLNNSLNIIPDLENYLPYSINEIDDMELKIQQLAYEDGIDYGILNYKYGGLPIRQVK